MIKACNISKRFGGVQALAGVGFAIDMGEILGIAGLNGAGKSTLLSILSGIMKPDSGTVEHLGVDIFKARYVKPLSIGYVPQEIALFDNLSVTDNLRFWASAGRKPRRVRHLVSSPGDRVQATLEACSLTGHRRKKVSELSGGMKRRANIAAALVMEPDALIMDEPTAGLDAKNRKDMLHFIQGLVKQVPPVPQKGPPCVVFTSHQAGELESICDRVILLDKGTVAFDGLLSQVSLFFKTRFMELGTGCSPLGGVANNNMPFDFENLAIDDILYILGSAN